MKRRLAPLALALVFGADACRKAEPAAGTSPAAPDASAATAAPASDAGLVTDKALLDGSLVEVSHSKWDGGRTADLFDTDPATLARTEKANPAIVEIRFPNPRPLKGVSVTTGGMDAELTVSVRPQGGGAPKIYTKDFRKLPPDPTFGLEFDTGTAPIESLRVEIKDLNGGDGHIHIRAVKLL